MIDHLFEEVGLDCVDHIEQVVPSRTLSNCILIREILGDFLVIGDLRPERFDRQFLVLRHMDEGHIRFLQQLFLFRKDLLQKVLVDGSNRWKVELH